VSSQGRYRGTPVDVTLRMYGIVIWVIPIFWLALMLQLTFAIGLRWLPPNGRLSPLTPIPTPRTGLYTIDSLLMGRYDIFIDAVRHLILPSLTLGLVLSGFFTRIVRVNMMQTLQSDFVEAARARGIRERSVIYRHAFKNALIPVVTVIGLQFAALLGGAILTETTFSLNGVGQLLVRAIIAGDYTMVQGIIVFYAILVIFVSLAVDIANAFIDPRIKY